MKAFYRTAIGLGLSLAILFLTIGSAAAADVIEIRGPVFNGGGIDCVIDNGIKIDATQFAAFYYDVDNDVTGGNETESFAPWNN
ncbi:hypothetical protein [Methanosarcina sp.]|uniref:hypothetical protein n=1 Tax=Methanosarcina sp. TaxID=2213 RepID=UPI003C7444BE